MSVGPDGDPLAAFAVAREQLQAERQRLVERVAEIDAALGATRPVVARPAVGRRGPRRTGTRVSDVLDYLRKNPGATLHEIFAATGVCRGYVYTLVRRGHLRAEGHYGSHRYFVIDGATDEAGA